MSPRTPLSSITSSLMFQERIEKCNLENLQRKQVWSSSLGLVKSNSCGSNPCWSSKLFVQWSNGSVQKLMLFRHFESKIKPWSSNEFGMQWKSINTLQYLRLIHFQGETGIANIKVGCARMQKSSAHKCKSLEHTNAVLCTPMHKCSSRFNWLLVWRSIEFFWNFEASAI